MWLISVGVLLLVAVPIHRMPTARQDAVREANRRIAKAIAHTANTIEAITMDGVHLTAEDYSRWFGAIEEEVYASKKGT